jgi:hypothetical protein
MTDTLRRQAGGRFGAAAPGARPERFAPEPGPGAEGPPAPRRRLRPRTVIAAGAAIIVVAAAYAAGHFTAPGPPALRSLLVTSAPLAAGTPLTRADLSVVQVPADDQVPAGALAAAAASRVTRLVTRTALAPGTFLSDSLLASSGEMPGPGQALVGLALKPGQVPAGGLADGQSVLVVLLPTSSSGLPLAPVRLATTTVWDVQGATASQSEQATVIVPVRQAVRLAEYAAAGQVALVQTNAGDGGAS